MELRRERQQVLELVRPELICGALDTSGQAAAYLQSERDLSIAGMYIQSIQHLYVRIGCGPTRASHAPPASKLLQVSAGKVMS